MFMFSASMKIDKMLNHLQKLKILFMQTFRHIFSPISSSILILVCVVRFVQLQIPVIKSNETFSGKTIRRDLLAYIWSLSIPVYMRKCVVKSYIRLYNWSEMYSQNWLKLTEKLFAIKKVTES